MSLLGRLALISALTSLCAGAFGADFDARFKAFGVGRALPERDVQRQLIGTPLYDMNLDMRLMFAAQKGGFSFSVENTTLYQAGDSLAFLNSPQNTLDQTPTDDSRRVMDLTWTIDDGRRHQTLNRLDRLYVRYSNGPYRVTLGRQAVSWGNGIAFQPLDLFSPFAPTTVDRDYKAGDDLLQIEKLNDNGSDMQLLAVGRRDDQGRITGQAHSVAGKWHGFVAGGELELVAAKHYVDQVYAFALRYPLGGALVRSDWVGTRLRDGDWKLSAIVNLDYSLVVKEHNVYVFGEYFYNGFGVNDLPASPVLLPDPLKERLARGEVFSLMKHYLAMGANVEWHPLISQTLTLITNLTDASQLIQTQVTYNPGDHQMLEAGVVFSLGHPGEEFGGVPLAGTRLTSGGGTHGYLRWVWYF